MYIKWMTILIAAAFITSCKFQFSANDTTTTGKEVSSSTNPGPTGGAKILNDIALDATAIKVSQAYLADGNEHMLDSNFINLGEKIYCAVGLDTGWTKHSGKSFIGASEIIMTDDGTVILDAPDLFQDYNETGLDAANASVISLSVNITKKQPGVNNYKVQFRIWDKRGSGEVKGSFKFKVK